MEIEDQTQEEQQNCEVSVCPRCREKSWEHFATHNYCANCNYSTTTESKKFWGNEKRLTPTPYLFSDQILLLEKLLKEIGGRK